MNLLMIIKVNGLGSLIVFWITWTKLTLITFSMQNLDLTSWEPELSIYWMTSNAFSKYFSAYECSFRTILVSILCISLGITTATFSISPILQSIIDKSSWGIWMFDCSSYRTKNESIASITRSLLSS